MSDVEIGQDVETLEALDWQPDCDCAWCLGSEQAVWIVRWNPVCVDHRPRVRLWCDPCLQAVLSSERKGFCCEVCGATSDRLPRDHVLSYEALKVNR